LDCCISSSSGIIKFNYKTIMKKYNQGHTLYCGGYAGAIAIENATGEKLDPVKIFKETDRIFEKSNGGGLAVSNVMRYLQLKGYIENFTRISPEKKWINKYLKDGIVLVKVSNYKYRKNTFYYDKRSRKAHIMAVTGSDDDYTYTYNSWNDGECKIRTKDFKNLIVMKGKLAKKKHVYKYFSEKEIYKLKPELVDKLDKARGIAGIPFKINSGFRTPEHNKRIGGKPDSSHLKGLAVDLHCKDSKSRYKILTSLLEVGFNRIGLADTFIHCDISDTKPQNVIWKY